MNFLSILLLSAVFLSSGMQPADSEDVVIVTWTQIEVGEITCDDGRTLTSYAIISTTYDTASGDVEVTHAADLIACCECAQGVTVENIVIEAGDDADPQHIMSEDTFRQKAIEYYQSVLAKN